MRAFGLSLLLLLAGASAFAEDRDLAKDFYAVGEKLYRRGDYEGALQAFEKAHRFAVRPELVFNIARCHELLGNLEEALRHYREYLRSRPDEALVRARIENLEARIRGRARREPAAPRPRRTSLALPGWIAAGAGAALLATGAILGWQASRRAGEIDDASRAAQPVYYDTLADTQAAGERLEAGAIASFCLGGAALASGIVMLVVEARRAPSSERAAWVRPTPVPGGAAFSAGLRF